MLLINKELNQAPYINHIFAKKHTSNIYKYH